MRQSSSLPSLSGQCSRLVESTLYVARGVSGSQSPAEWLPMRFAHNSDGSISFWSAAQSETFLDADWSQLFTVAPWKPIQSDGRSLYPFSLSSVPLPGRPRYQQGPQPSETALRRNLMLAAPSDVLRRRWLSSLARKIGSTQLRPSSTWGELEDGADAVDRPKRRFMELGALQAGLEKTRFLGRSIPRLPPARAEFWEAKSSLQMVRDLYDGYASDPLSCQPLHGEQGGKSDDFMSQYLEKQAVIEFLLHRKQGRLEEVKTASCKAETRHQEQVQAVKPSQVEKEVKIVTGCSFQLLAWTENLKFQEDILRNEQWSGGAIFARANMDDPSFELAVSPQDCPESHPIIIGIAPPDADLSQANFFGSCGGVFMCLGGSASEGRLGAMGAPGGPFIQGFGQRQRPDLPKGHRGCQVQINFTEAVDTTGQLLGHVCFMVTDERGRHHQHVPKFRRQIEGGVGWFPCILLCNPDTSVQVLRLK